MQVALNVVGFVRMPGRCYLVWRATRDLCTRSFALMLAYSAVVWLAYALEQHPQTGCARYEASASGVTSLTKWSTDHRSSALTCQAG